MDKAVEAALRGEFNVPAPIIATIIRNIRQYDNQGTISGSQLHQECELKGVLEKHVDYATSPEDQYYASFRGSNVHAMIETCDGHTDFSGWLFEKRFFGILNPDGTLSKFEPPLQSNGELDKAAFKAIIQELRAAGCNVLSGQIDSFDIKNGVIWDWKTAKMVGAFTEVKPSWQQQLTQYRLLLELHGYKVNGIMVCVMDATQPVVREIEMVDLNFWVKNYLTPRSVQLAELKRIGKEEVDAYLQGVDIPLMPKPTPNYLCNKSGRDKKVYCPVRDVCPAWINESEKGL